MTSPEPIESGPPDGADQPVIFTECKHCGTRSYPARKWCASCLRSDLETHRLSKQAVVYASSTVHLGPAVFDPPYTLAYLDVDGIRVLARRPGAAAVSPGESVEVASAPSSTVFGIAGGGVR